MKFEVLIIGGGPAAITISKTLGPQKKVGVIRPEEHSMIYCAMPYVIEKILSLEKTYKKDALVTDAGATLIRDIVTGVDLGNKKVQTAGGKTYEYDKLVIATGATPLLPGVEGNNLPGVMTFKTSGDLSRILNATQNGLRKAVVVGAGAIGIELTQAFSKIGVETHLVDMEEHILPNMMDKEMTEEAEDQLRAAGTHIHLGNRVISLTGGKNVEEVVLSNSNRIHFNSTGDPNMAERADGLHGIVVFAVGMNPNVELFKNTALKIGTEGIIVNEKMETNIEDVYAVGDCVQFKSGITNEIVSGKLATNAVPMGRVLAKNILGGKRVYKGFFNGTATKIENVFVGSTGLTEKSAVGKYDILVGYSELTTIFPIMPEAKKVRIKLIGDRKEGKIIGGQVISGMPVTDKVDLITMAIQYGLTIEELAGLSYSAQPYQSFFPANNLIVAAAEDMLMKI